MPNRPVYIALATALVALVVGFSAIAYAVVSNGNRTVEIRHLALDNQTRSVDTARQSRLACVRTRRFGPPWYAQHHVLRPDELAAYRETIPASCP